MTGLTAPVTTGTAPSSHRAAGSSRRWLRWPAAVAAAAIVLFFVYLQVAERIRFNSDGAVIEQQAWDMLHGNLLMRGWTFADLAFYTIEIPEFAVLEWLRGGMSPGLMDVAEALNLTVFVLLVALLAKGRATGREGMIRALIAAGIVFAPIPGPDGALLLGNPDHLATQIPLLAVWLILDRARPRWWVPVTVAALLAWARMSDSIVLLEGEIPLLAVCAVRMYRRRGSLREHRYELSLAAAAIAAEGVALLALRMIRAAGGFTAYPLQENFAPVAQLSSHIWVTAESVLALYSADFSGAALKGNLALLMPAVHLAGVLLAAVATWYAVRRFFVSDLMVQVLTVAMVTSLAAYTLLGGPTAIGGAHDLMPVLPIGAVLAGRLLTAGVIRRGLIPALAVVLALYSGFLVRDAVQPRPAVTAMPLATWLQEHGLRYGLSSYYTGSLVSVDTGDQVMAVPVKRIGNRLILSPWESTTSWYSPAQHDATFFLANQMQGCPPGDASFWVAAARRAFGPPARTYSVDGVQVLVWNGNLLSHHLATEPVSRPSAC